ncbi:hypothetical protein FISHEDRAFT_42403 [Fistulina hepatica ATCC 64428]|uniref:LsmAD domain-containing protein n=1 Tax=Fistulina hepatica ATCC 64428 TaxID=1128425 RepID=A0A0D7AGD2_9AGAR|nr:hypothetical protein FISHEDRAFT_42403 [Fistulina hepatica ATCC 64428]
MATPARQAKPANKKPTDTRRFSAWSGARTSSTYSAGSTPQRSSTPATPTPTTTTTTNNNTPLVQLAGLSGKTITLYTRTGQRYEGLIHSTSAEGDTTGVTLRDVRDLSTTGAPLKDTLFIAATNIDRWLPAPADDPATVAALGSHGTGTNFGGAFRTDADITAKRGPVARERELQVWQPESHDSAQPPPPLGAHGDDVTFGPQADGGSWDQFATNEQKFGIRTNFDEDVYTTRLDRSAPDFKEREKKAQRIANEIIGVATNNLHLAEERGQIDDSGVNEEDKYGAVVRGPNAYVPPGARKNGDDKKPSEGVPRLAINGHSPSPSPRPSREASKDAPRQQNSKPSEALPAFLEFVTNEKQRLTQKRQAMMKSEMDKRMAELVAFSHQFKLNKPMPDDLVPILAKDEEKQRAIRDKASHDAQDGHARSIAPPGTATVMRPTGNTARVNSSLSSSKVSGSVAAMKGKMSTTASVKFAVKPIPPRAGVSTTGKTDEAKSADKPAENKPRLSAGGKPLVPMVIQPIPPFKGGKSRPTSDVPTKTDANARLNGAAAAGDARLNVNASSFKPNPKANAFTPSSPSLKPTKAAKEQNGPPNPFFGASRPLKKHGMSPHIKDDFNPFKLSRVVDANTVVPMWGYSGKRHIHMFPPTQPMPPQPSQMPMVPPPPSYEEDSAAQAAARGYVYAYPGPYGYPGQVTFPRMYIPMMPPGPPGAYMSGPYMQPMPYPPGMPPPPNGQAGAYPNGAPPAGTFSPAPGAGYNPAANFNGAAAYGAGGRPPMPPYFQSPQMGHAVPYPMMMPPQPQAGYEGGPPVPMGGHA